MSLKSKITMFAIIMYLSLICVGFASWTLSVDTKDAVSSDNVITSETVINSNDEITIGQVTNFKYFNNGFIDEENFTLTYSAKITVELIVNKEKCAEVSAELNINELISGLAFDSITCVIDGSSDNTVYGTKVTIDTSLMTSDTVTLVYTLNASKDTFISKVYTPLYTNQDKNIFSIELNVTKENLEE